MQQNHKELLDKVFCEVIENLAFMFAETMGNEEAAGLDGEGVRAHMAFSGPFQGAIELATPRALCSELAANVLGVDAEDELTGIQAEDAIKELLNVTCGHVLTVLAGEEPVFDLTVPTVTPMSASEWAALAADPNAATLLVEDKPVLLRLRLES